MFVKKLDRAGALVEYGIPTQRNFPWKGVVEPPFGSMWGFLATGMKTDMDVHDDFETIVVTQGSGRMTVGDEVKDVSAGDIIFIPGGVPHTIENMADEELVTLFVWWEAPATAP